MSAHAYIIRPAEQHAYGVEVVTPTGDIELFTERHQAERWIARIARIAARTGGVA